ncbi:MAG: aminotransferase class I/II-fold pyridoxal phosphate-dependent enzyme [Anaerolineales bacterium]
MPITPFHLERYFAKYEFSARYLLSSSDCESLPMGELLDMADEDMREQWEQLRLGYTESWGHPLLREEIARIYQGIDPSGVLTLVPEEGIYLLMHALLQAGDHVICTLPGYQSLYEVARSIGCQVSTWQPDEAQGWNFPLEQLADALKANTRLVVINFPHNPTGFTPSKDEFSALIELVRDQGAYLLSDEMYRYLEVEPGTTLPAACENYEHAVSLSGLSKSFGLPGLRVGWLASQDGEVLERVSRLKDYTTICGSAPSELLAITALRNRMNILGQQIKRVRKNLAGLEAFINQHREWFTWNRPLGGSICFPKMLGVDDTYTFCERLVTETGIMLAPSRVFQYGDHHVRIGFGRENLPRVLELFAEYLARNGQ